MGMITSLNMNNYKCYSDLTTVELKPLTILCGTNSSGKSSLIESMLMLKQSYENTYSTSNMTLNGAYTMCGSFKDLSSNRNNEPVTIGINFNLDKPSKSGAISKTDLAVFKTLTKLFPRSSSIISFDVELSVTVAPVTKAVFLEDNRLKEQHIVLTVNYKNSECIKAEIHLQHKKSNKYEVQLVNIPDMSNNEVVPRAILHDCSCYFESFGLSNAYATKTEPAGLQVSGLLASAYSICRTCASEFRAINYLTPLRVYPQSSYARTQDTSGVGIGGEYTPHVLQAQRDSNIAAFYPPSIDSLHLTNKKDKFTNFVQEWMHYLDFGDYSLERYSNSLELSISGYNVQNVGFGVCQVLPILVSGLLQKRGEMLLLEQPEIHLHPRAQMAIADFLLSMAIADRRLVVETHSDHIINRVVRRIMENPMLRDYIAIYFVDKKPQQTATIEQISIDPVYGAICDNENFFTQFASETEKIVTTGYANKNKG